MNNASSTFALWADAVAKQLIALPQAISSRVQQAIAHGPGPEDAHKAVTLDDQARRLANGDDWRVRGFRSAFLAPAIDRAHQEVNSAMKIKAEE